MEFTNNNGNTKVQDHHDRGLSLYVFEETSVDGVMSYVGEYEYQDHDWTTATDDNDHPRDAIRFWLVPKDGLDFPVAADDVEGASEREIFQAAKENQKVWPQKTVPPHWEVGDGIHARRDGVQISGGGLHDLSVGGTGRGRAVGRSSDIRTAGRAPRIVVRETPCVSRHCGKSEISRLQSERRAF